MVAHGKIDPTTSYSKSVRRTSVVLLLLTASSLCSLPVHARDADGERLFQQRCTSCHSLEEGQNRNGPHLSGIFGRAAGRVDGANYSSAMRSSGINWDAQSLDSFLAAPSALVRGTRMPVGVPNAEQRAAIISYLESQSRHQ
jgi:cytochrome c